MTPVELVQQVDTAFERTGRGLRAWAAPHPERTPADDEYSRVTDTEKWRILGARADAWLEVLAVAGLARVETDVEIDGPRSRARSSPPPIGRCHTRRLRRRSWVGRSRIESVDDAGVPLGVGDPAILLGAVPACGCDACDHGSEPDLRELDECVLAVVIGHDGPLRGGSGWGLVSANGEPPHSTAG